MQFSLILSYVQDRFDTLRKPNGKPYKTPQGNIKRSIMCSLTSNGVFQKVAHQAAQQLNESVTPQSHKIGQKVDKKDQSQSNTEKTAAQRDINKELWQVNDERAGEYFLDMRAKLEVQKEKLAGRKRKYPAQ